MLYGSKEESESVPRWCHQNFFWRRTDEASRPWKGVKWM